MAVCARFPRHKPSSEPETNQSAFFRVESSLSGGALPLSGAELAVFVLTINVLALPVSAQVLGPCGGAAENESAPAEAPAASGGKLVPAGIPLPGERATNFELQAIVGDEIKNVEFAMASDPSDAVSRTYGVWQAGSGLNKRGRFIIDPDGIIQGVEVLAGPIGRNVDELLRQIQAMQAVRANPGKAAPAEW